MQSLQGLATWNAGRVLRMGPAAVLAQSLAEGAGRYATVRSLFCHTRPAAWAKGAAFPRNPHAKGQSDR
jgi:hypothetical protein